MILFMPAWLSPVEGAPLERPFLLRQKSPGKASQGLFFNKEKPWEKKAMPTRGTE